MIIPWGEGETRVKPLRHQNVFCLQTFWKEINRCEPAAAILPPGYGLSITDTEDSWRCFFMLVPYDVWAPQTYRHRRLGSWQSRPCRWGLVVSRCLRKIDNHPRATCGAYHWAYSLDPKGWWCSNSAVITLLCVYHECTAAGQSYVSCCWSFTDITLGLEAWDCGGKVDYHILLDNRTIPLLSAKNGVMQGYNCM